MSDTLARIASLLLATAFGWAAIAKLSGFSRWRVTVASYELPPSVERAAAPLIPVIELLLAFACVVVPRVGAAAALATLAAFSLAILRARSRRGDRLPCGCFGGTKERDFKTMLLRNAGLGVLAGVTLIASGDGSVALSAPTASDLVPVVLVLLGAALILWVTLQSAHLLRRRDGR